MIKKLIRKAIVCIIDGDYGAAEFALREALDHSADVGNMAEPVSTGQECRHCGWLCKPNANESKKFYPLEQEERTNEALIDELVICGIYQREHDNDPRKALLDVIHWHVTVALDPAVSAEARALQNTSRAEQRVSQEPVKVTGAMVYAFHHALTDAAIGAGEFDEIKLGLEAAFANIAAPQPVWSAEECDRVVKTLRYIQGIVERGELRAMREDETLEQFVLGYVKRLEQVEQPMSQEPVAWTTAQKRNAVKHWAFDCGWDELTEVQIDDLELLVTGVINTAPQPVKEVDSRPVTDALIEAFNIVMGSCSREQAMDEIEKLAASIKENNK